MEHILKYFYVTGRATLARREADDNERKLIVQEDVEEGTIDLQSTVIFKKAQLPELIHK